MRIKMFKKFIVVCGIFLVVIMVVSGVNFFMVYDGDIVKFKNRMEMLKEPVDLSTLTIVDLTGKEHTIGASNGTPRILMLWATWCKYCRRDIPQLSSFLAQQASEGIQVIPIAVPKDTSANLKRYFQQLGISNISTYTDPTGSIFKALKVQGIPYYVMIDEGGKAVATIRPQWDKDLKKLLDR